MKEYERNILAEYPVDVISIRQGRGAYLCTTRQGLFLFQQIHSSKSRIPYVQYICEQLMENGLQEVSYMLPNARGEYISYSGDGTGYILKRWFTGRECDVRREKDVLDATCKMAELHQILKRVSGQVRVMESMITIDPVCQHFVGEKLPHLLRRHNTELKKVQKFIGKRVEKDRFERLYLESFPKVYELARKVEYEVLDSDYDILYTKAVEERSIVHGAFNYHNVIMMEHSGIGIVNLEHFRVDTQMVDLYYFFRKVMEKQGWNQSMAYKILCTYDKIKSIEPQEMEYLKLRLAYPEKYWKIANAYYNSNKAWFSVKNLEKMRATVEELPIKFNLLNNIFSSHL